MKKLFFASCLGIFLVSMADLAFGLQCTDNLNEYSDGSSIIDQGLGSGDWGGSKWERIGGESAVTFTSYDFVGDFYGIYKADGTEGNMAYRSFAQPFGAVTSATFRLYHGADSEAPYRFFFSSGTSEGISVALKTIDIDDFRLVVYENGNIQRNICQVANPGTGDCLVTITAVDFYEHSYTFEVAGVPGSHSAEFNYDIASFDRCGLGGQTNGDGVYVRNIDIQGSAVPEPSSVAFFGMGLLGLAGAGWSRFRKQ